MIEKHVFKCSDQLKSHSVLNLSFTNYNNITLIVPKYNHAHNWSTSETASNLPSAGQVVLQHVIKKCERKMLNEAVRCNKLMSHREALQPPLTRASIHQFNGNSVEEVGAPSIIDSFNIFRTIWVQSSWASSGLQQNPYTCYPGVSF